MYTNKYIFFVITVIVAIAMHIAGCRKKSGLDEDPVVYAIRKSVKSPRFPQIVRDRADLAVSKWRNGVLDEKPILINACLNRYEPNPIPESMALTVYSEQKKKIIGFGIKEEHIKENGQRDIIEEKYPAFIHRPLDEIANVWAVQIDIRTSDERKDEEIWEKFIESNEIADEYKKYDELVNSRKLRAILPVSFPIVWVSIPEPNEVNVLIWVYDKDGNESEPVELLDFEYEEPKSQIETVYPTD